LAHVVHGDHRVSGQTTEIASTEPDEVGQRAQEMPFALYDWSEHFYDWPLLLVREGNLHNVTACVGARAHRLPSRVGQHGLLLVSVP